VSGKKSIGLAKIDAAALELQAQAFYDAGELLYADKLDEAKAALSAAATMKGGAELTQAPKSSTSKTTSSSKTTTTATTSEHPSILASLQLQLEDRLPETRGCREIGRNDS